MTGSELSIAGGQGVGAQGVARHFAEHQRLTVRQRKRWAEILLNFEMKNSYEVFDEGQSSVLRVEEVGEGIGAFLARMLLGPMRPLDVRVVNSRTGETLLRLQRPFRFIFHRLEVQAGSGEKLGAIEREWSWLRRIYRLEDAHGRTILTIFGPILKPWTFELQEHGRKVGMIQKRWSGFGKELFTDADNFGVELTEISDPIARALAFAATVLIDVVHFERAKS